MTVRSSIKWVVPLLLALPLIWLGYDQSVKLNKALNTKAKSQKELDEMSATSVQQEEISSLKREQRLLLAKVEQLVNLLLQQGVPLPNDGMRCKCVIGVKGSGYGDNLDVRLWLPAGKRVTAIVEKTTGVQNSPPNWENLVAAEFKNAGWHSITSKFEKAKPNNRLSLIVDGQEFDSIDLPEQEWRGGCIYSEGGLPAAFHKTQSLHPDWNMLYLKNGREQTYGYSVPLLRIQAASTEANVPQE